MLEVSADLDATTAAFVSAGRRALDRGAEVLVLGCAGFTGMQQRLQDALGVPVVDGVASAVALAEGLVRLGLRTSAHGTYATPLPKERDART